MNTIKHNPQIIRLEDYKKEKGSSDIKMSSGNFESRVFERQLAFG